MTSVATVHLPAAAQAPTDRSSVADGSRSGAGSPWRALRGQRALRLLLLAAVPVEIAAAASLVLRVGAADETGISAGTFGLVMAVMAGAFALAVLPAGILVDRLPIRATFVAALLLRAAPMALGGLIGLTWGLTTGLLVALAVADGLAKALLRPSWQRFQAAIVPVHCIGPASVLDDWVARFGALVGAALGGTAVALSWSVPGLAVCAVGFVPLLVVICIGLGRGLRSVGGRDSAMPLPQAIKAVRQDRSLRAALGADVLLQLAIPLGALAPAILIALDAVEQTWMVTTSAGVGALLGTTWVTLRPLPGRMRRILLASGASLATILFLNAVLLHYGVLQRGVVSCAVMCVAVAVAAGAAAAMFTVTGAVVQVRTPAGARGRVTAAALLPKHIALAFSSLVAGMAVEFLNPAGAVLAFAVAVVLAMAALRGFRAFGRGAARAGGTAATA